MWHLCSIILTISYIVMQNFTLFYTIFCLRIKNNVTSIFDLLYFTILIFIDEENIKYYKIFLIYNTNQLHVEYVTN